MDAPSALDEQPWQFLIIQNKDTLKELPQHHNHSDLIADAPACILVCADLSLEKLPGFWVQDCSACSQNILLAAHECGLGAVWVGVYPTESNVDSIRKFFNLPQTIIPFCLIALGYPDESYPEKNNFKKERIHYEKWT